MADIKKELNAIKNAVYGKEVRGSIHDGIKKINDEVENATDLSESAKHQVETIQQQVNQLVIEGDSSVEAAQARVDADGNVFTTLKERLDTKEQSFSAQLADNTNKIGILSNDVENIKNGAINDNSITSSKLKISTDADKIKLVNLADEVLQAMAGETPVNATPGILSTTNEKIAPGAVSIEKTNFVKNGKNLFNKDVALKDMTLSSEGNAVPFSGYYVSDYIPVEVGQQYTLSNPRSYAFYDVSKNVIPGSFFNNASNATVTVTVPANAYYIRVTVAASYLDTFQIEKGETKTAFEPYRITIPNLQYTVKTDDIEPSAVTPEKTNFVKLGKNLFNKDTALKDYLLSGAESTLGQPVPSSDYYVSDFIPVEAGQQYTLSNPRNYVFYNRAKSVISFHNNPGNPTVTVTVPANAVYMRVSVYTNYLSTFQIEKGTTKTAFEPYKIIIPKLDLEPRVSALENSVANIAVQSQKKLTVYKNGDNLKIRSSFDQTNDIVIEVKKDDTRNQLFNFVATWIVPKGATDAQISPTVTVGEKIHDTSDDITPIRTFDTVGANHGYSCMQITASGKTAADIGSQWTDGTRIYTLLNVSGNTLTFGFQYVETDGIVSADTTLPAVNLTHVSGATNTDPIDVSTKTKTQLYPSVNNHSLKFFLDEVELTQDGIFYGNELQVRETYNVMDYKALIDYARANIGTHYAQNRDVIDGVVRLGITYTFREGGKCVIHHNFRALKKLSILNCGFIQSVAMSLSGHTLYQYLPNVLPKGGYDFRNLVDMTNYSTDLIFYPSDYENPTIPPHRFVSWLKNTSTSAKKVGFTMGYIIDKSDSSHTDRLANTTQGWDLRNTKKNYPIAMNGKTLNPGEYFNFICYRNYLSPNIKPNATNVTTVEVGNETYVYIDYHESVNFETLELPEHIGKTVTVIEKSESFTLHNDIVDHDGVLFSISNGYGYGILKIS